MCFNLLISFSSLLSNFLNLANQKKLKKLLDDNNNNNNITKESDTKETRKSLYLNAFKNSFLSNNQKNNHILKFNNSINSKNIYFNEDNKKIIKNSNSNRNTNLSLTNNNVSNKENTHLFNNNNNINSTINSNSKFKNFEDNVKKLNYKHSETPKINIYNNNNLISKLSPQSNIQRDISSNNNNFNSIVTINDRLNNYKSYYKNSMFLKTNSNSVDINHLTLNNNTKRNSFNYNSLIRSNDNSKSHISLYDYKFNNINKYNRSNKLSLDFLYKNKNNNCIFDKSTNIMHNKNNSLRLNNNPIFSPFKLNNSYIKNFTNDISNSNLNSSKYTLFKENNIHFKNKDNLRKSSTNKKNSNISSSNITNKNSNLMQDELIKKLLSLKNNKLQSKKYSFDKPKSNKITNNKIEFNHYNNKILNKKHTLKDKNNIKGKINTSTDSLCFDEINLNKSTRSLNKNTDGNKIYKKEKSYSNFQNFILSSAKNKNIFKNGDKKNTKNIQNKSEINLNKNKFLNTVKFLQSLENIKCNNNVTIVSNNKISSLNNNTKLFNSFKDKKKFNNNNNRNLSYNFNQSNIIDIINNKNKNKLSNNKLKIDINNNNFNTNVKKYSFDTKNIKKLSLNNNNILTKKHSLNLDYNINNKDSKESNNKINEEIKINIYNEESYLNKTLSDKINDYNRDTNKSYNKTINSKKSSYDKIFNSIKNNTSNLKDEEKSETSIKFKQKLLSPNIKDPLKSSINKQIDKHKKILSNKNLYTNNNSLANISKKSDEEDASYSNNESKDNVDDINNLDKIQFTKANNSNSKLPKKFLFRKTLTIINNSNNQSYFNNILYKSNITDNNSNNNNINSINNKYIKNYKSKKSINVSTYNKHKTFLQKQSTRLFNKSIEFDRETSYYLDDNNTSNCNIYINSESSLLINSFNGNSNLTKKDYSYYPDLYTNENIGKYIKEFTSNIIKNLIDNYDIPDNIISDFYKEKVINSYINKEGKLLNRHQYDSVLLESKQDDISIRNNCYDSCNENITNLKFKSKLIRQIYNHLQNSCKLFKKKIQKSSQYLRYLINNENNLLNNTFSYTIYNCNLYKNITNIEKHSSLYKKINIYNKLKSKNDDIKRGKTNEDIRYENLTKLKRLTNNELVSIKDSNTEKKKDSTTSIDNKFVNISNLKKQKFLKFNMDCNNNATNSINIFNIKDKKSSLKRSNFNLNKKNIDILQYKSKLLNISNLYFNKKVKFEKDKCLKNSKNKKVVEIFKLSIGKSLIKSIINEVHNIESPKVSYINEVCSNIGEFKSYINYYYYDVYNIVVAFINKHKFSKIDVSKTNQNTINEYVERSCKEDFKNSKNNTMHYDNIYNFNKDIVLSPYKTKNKTENIKNKKQDYFKYLTFTSKTKVKNKHAKKYCHNKIFNCQKTYIIKNNEINVNNSIFNSPMVKNQNLYSNCNTDKKCLQLSSNNININLLQKITNIQNIYINFDLINKRNKTKSLNFNRKCSLKLNSIDQVKYISMIHREVNNEFDILNYKNNDCKIKRLLTKKLTIVPKQVEAIKAASKQIKLKSTNKNSMFKTFDSQKPRDSSDDFTSNNTNDIKSKSFSSSSDSFNKPNLYYNNNKNSRKSLNNKDKRNTDNNIYNSLSNLLKKTDNNEVSPTSIIKKSDNACKFNYI